MTDLYLKLESEPGADIRRTANEAQRVADMLAIDIKFQFNGVECTALPGGDAAMLAQRQQDSQQSRGGFKWANSRVDEFSSATTKLDNASTKPTETVPGASSLIYLKEAAHRADAMSQGNKKFSLELTTHGVEIIGEFYIVGWPSQFGENRFRISWEQIDQANTDIIGLALRDLDKSLEKMLSELEVR